MEKIWKGLLLIFLIPVIVWAAADPSAFIYAPKGWEIQSSCTGIKDNGSGCWNGSTLCIGNGTSCVGVSASSISSYLDITKWFSSGTCSGYLKSDGTCDAGGITPGLNIDPTGNVSVGANGKISVGVGGNFSIGAGSTLKIEPNLPAIVDITLNLQQIFQGLGSVGPNAVGCFNSSGLPVACTNLTDIAIPTGTMASQNSNGVAITGGNISLTNITVNDFLYMSVDAGIDTPFAPSAATKIQGNVTQINPSNVVAANGTYTTFTAGTGGNVTAAVSASAANATITFSGLTVGRLVHYQFTPTLTSGSVPTLALNSGATLSSLCTLANATICDSYFTPTSANVVIGFSTAGAANFALASTTAYEYSRTAIGRDFSHTTAQALLYDIYFPYDWNAGNVYAKIFNVVDQSSAPAANNTIIYQIAGFCVGTNDSLDYTMGTGVNATFTAGANMTQYQEAITNESGAITLNGAGVGKKCRVQVQRLTSDTYTQPIAETGMRIRFGRVMSGTYGGN